MSSKSRDATEECATKPGDRVQPKPADQQDRQTRASAAQDER